MNRLFLYRVCVCCGCVLCVCDRSHTKKFELVRKVCTKLDSLLLHFFYTHDNSICRVICCDCY